jgi:hypothetical protein
VWKHSTRLTAHIIAGYLLVAAAHETGAGQWGEAADFSRGKARLGLVIGNGAYRVSPPRNTVHDAVDVGETLTKLGFTVDVLTDIDRRAMLTALHRFAERLSALDAVGLF